MCSTWNYNYVDIDPNEKFEEWDYSVEPEHSRRTVMECARYPLTDFNIASRVVSHFVRLKSWGFLDWRQPAECKEACSSQKVGQRCFYKIERLLDRQVQWFKLDKGSRLKLIIIYFHDFQYIGYRAARLQFWAGDTPLSDLAKRSRVSTFFNKDKFKDNVFEDRGYRAYDQLFKE